MIRISVTLEGDDELWVFGFETPRELVRFLCYVGQGPGSAHLQRRRIARIVQIVNGR